MLFERGDQCVVADGGGGGGKYLGGWRGGGRSGGCGDSGVQLVLEHHIFSLKGVKEVHLLFVVLFACSGGGHGHRALVGTCPFESDFESRAVGPDGVKEILGFRPPLELGSIIPEKDLEFCKDAAFVHIVDIRDDFERVVERHFQLFHCSLPFVELDGVRLDVNGGVVSPEEFEGVGAGHLFVVLYLHPRLGEVGENGQWGLIAEPHLLLVKLYEVLCLDVCDEHGEADLCHGLLDMVGRPDGIVVLREAEEIFLSRLIGDIRMDICWFGQLLV